jgi:hypothetical protein
MEPDEIQERRRRAETEVNRVRGDFLAAVIDLEAHLDRAIVYYFAPDELHLFISLFIERMGLTQKINAFRKMLRHMGMDEKQKALLKEIESLAADRNRFAHEGFELVGTSYLWEEDFELYRKERLDPGPRAEDIIRVSELQELVDRAQKAEGETLDLAKELTAAHDPPTEYFQRPGWDPRNLFGSPPDPNNLLEDEE